MSLFSFLKRNKESYSLVFDIGSGSISGGIIRFTEKAGVDLAYYCKEIISFQDEVQAVKHLEFMKSALALVTEKIRSEGLKKINSTGTRLFSFDRVFYIFSSPWCQSQTKIIRVNEAKPFRITEDYLNRLIDGQEKEFQKDIPQSGKIIEKKIIQIKINGYPVSEIKKKTAKSLEAAVFFTIVPTDILRTVDESVSKFFHIRNSWCHSLSLAVFLNIRSLFPHMDDFICVNVTEEVTDISVTKENVVMSNASIPLGRNDFMRELSKVLGVTKEAADSQIKLHCLKVHDELAALRLSMAMDKAAAVWLARIFEILDRLKEKIYVPEFIFLVAGNDLSAFLKEKFIKHDFKVQLLDDKKIKNAALGDDIVFKMELLFLDNLYKI